MNDLIQRVGCSELNFSIPEVSDIIDMMNMICSTLLVSNARPACFIGYSNNDIEIFIT